jgi:hypothetical protein
MSKTRRPYVATIQPEYARDRGAVFDRPRAGQRDPRQIGAKGTSVRIISLDPGRLQLVDSPPALQCRQLAVEQLGRAFVHRLARAQCPRPCRRRTAVLSVRATVTYPET